MWKDFFSFSGSQRAGIIVLLVLIFLVLLIDFTLSFWVEQNFLSKDKLLFAEVELFQDSLIASGNAIYPAKSKKYPAKEKTHVLPDETSEDIPLLFLFDPNTLDSAGFIRLGLKPHVVSNILKYRRKGGKFREKDDLSGIYGMQPAVFSEISSYIRISGQNSFPDSSEPEEYRPLLELNTADTAALMEIKGIGKYYAVAIIRYRKALGGFYSVRQLQEISKMTSENYDRISPFCLTDTSMIKKIKINTASLEKLKSHPYLDFYQSKEIYELRRKKGKISGLEELSNIASLDSTALVRIAPYLSFD